MRRQRCSVRKRKKQKERRAHSPRRRPGEQQVKQYGRPGHPDERGSDARDGPGGEISTGAHGERRPMPTPAAARHRHHRGEDQDRGPDRSPYQDRVGMPEGDKAERQPGEAAEREAQQQPRGYRTPQSRNDDSSPPARPTRRNPSPDQRRLVRESYGPERRVAPSAYRFGRRMRPRSSRPNSRSRSGPQTHGPRRHLRNKTRWHR